MVLGWRRAFCTSVPKDREKQCSSDTNTICSNSPKPTSKLGFFSNSNSSSNPSTPRLPPVSSPTLRCRTSSSVSVSVSVATSSPAVHSKASSTTTTESPRSPSTFSLLKSTLRLSTKRSRCGICNEAAKSGQGSAIFTSECSHLFHLPCIAAHFKTHHQSLQCPLCDAAWKNLPHTTTHHLKPKSLRVYNDDEPLMSPTSAARFNPIPEEEEEEEEEEEPTEFQGFFVKPSSSYSPKSNGHNHNVVDVDLAPEAALLAVGKGFETCVVKMTVKAPPSGSGFRRPPIDLVAVIEVNGAAASMKRATRLLISSLSESDRLSVIAFSNASKRLLPLRRMTPPGRRLARGVLDALAGSTTGASGMCVADAVKKAAKVLEDRRQRNPSAAIVLFSAAGANPRSSITSTRLPNVDAPVHRVTVGACDDAPLAGLLTLVVQDLRLDLGFVSGSGQARVSGVYSVTGKPAVLGSSLVRVGDMFAGEERELLVELKVAAGSHQVLTIRPSFKDPSSGAIVRSSREKPLVVPRAQAVRSSSSGSIRQLRNLHVAVRAVAESRRLVEHEDYSGAHHMVSSARALLMKSSCGSSEEELLGSLEAEEAELSRRRKQIENKRKEKSEPNTPTSSWRAAERLAKVAIMRKSMNRVSDLHGFQNAGF